MMNKSYYILLLATLFSCRTYSLRDSMVGKWQTTYLKIEYPSHNGSDSLYVFEEKFDKLNAIVAQSVYYKNGTFVAWYLQPDGSKVEETKGKWDVVNDSLRVRYTYQNQDLNNFYKITPTQKGFKGVNLSDWDGDGQKDDWLMMETKKIK